MNYWKVILATVVIFGAGVMAGGLLVNHIDNSHPGNRRPSGATREPEDMVARPDILKTNFVQRLDEAVHLSPDQRDKIEKIVADGQQRNHDLWKIVSPQMRQVTQDVHRRIKDVLTADQQKQFEGLLKQLHPARRQSNSTNAPPDAVPMTNSPAV